MTTVAISTAAPARIAKGKLGVYFAWGAFSKRDGAIFTDSHGDQIPDEELVAGALSLAKSAQLGHEHDGTVTGSVPLVMPLPEDIQAALELTSPHAGLVVGFTPTAELAASLDAGEPWQMSIEGLAVAEDMAKATIAKSADGLAQPAHKRTLRQLQINKIDLVRSAAHGPGTTIAIAKRADRTAAPQEPMTDIAKRAPALTTVTNGHQHLVDDIESADGFTSYEKSPGSEYGHSHPFVRAADGSITVGAADGHAHDIANPGDATMADDLAKSLTADLAKARAALATAVTMPADQLAFAKRLQGADLDGYLTKSADDRAKLATPIHKSERTGRVFYAGEESLADLAKDADAVHVELAKARGDAQAAAIAKAAAAMPNVKGAALLAKAVHLLPEAERTEALAALAAIDATVAVITQPIGFGGNTTTDPASPQAELDAIAADIAKTKGVSIAKAADLALDTPRGAQLYKQIEGAKRATATA